MITKCSCIKFVLVNSLGKGTGRQNKKHNFEIGKTNLSRRSTKRLADCVKFTFLSQALARLVCFGGGVFFKAI